VSGWAASSWPRLEDGCSSPLAPAPRHPPSPLPPRPHPSRTAHTQGYLPGHIHAFWILYKKMRAEEMYGATGYIYVGNGEYQSTDPRRE
jgi:hypothetical protein